MSASSLARFTPSCACSAVRSALMASTSAFLAFMRSTSALRASSPSDSLACFSARPATSAFCFCSSLICSSSFFSSDRDSVLCAIVASRRAHSASISSALRKRSAPRAAFSSSR